MQTPLISTLNRLASLLKGSRGRTESAVVTETPLDPVERLHRNGSTFPVMMEFSRLGW